MKIELLCVTPDAERLVEAAGRTCYDTGDRAGDDTSARFIRMLIRRGHLSVLEHASATFRISAVSRALSHQLVRHRLASYSQRSQRYVKEDGFAFITPPSVAGRPGAAKTFEAFMDGARRTYEELLVAGVPPEDARFILPNACATEIVMTANFREWRHVIELRGAADAQWEIRRLAVGVAKVLKREAPAVFGDFDVDEAAHTVTRKEQGD